MDAFLDKSRVRIPLGILQATSAELGEDRALADVADSGPNHVALKTGVPGAVADASLSRHDVDAALRMPRSGLHADSEVDAEAVAAGVAVWPVPPNVGHCLR